jgi:hypothetical protein
MFFLFFFLFFVPPSSVCISLAVMIFKYTGVVPGSSQEADPSSNSDAPGIRRCVFELEIDHMISNAQVMQKCLHTHACMIPFCVRIDLFKCNISDSFGCLFVCLC